MTKHFGKVLAALALAALVGGCDRVADAKYRIAHSTRAPDAVQFRNVKVSGDTICGEINTKSPSGQYAGFTPFIAKNNDYGAIFPEFPPFTLATTVEELRRRLALDREGCESAVSLRVDMGIKGRAPQCAALDQDKRGYVAFKIYAARFRNCAGLPMPRPFPRS